MTFGVNDFNPRGQLQLTNNSCVQAKLVSLKLQPSASGSHKNLRARSSSSVELGLPNAWVVGVLVCHFYLLIKCVYIDISDTIGKKTELKKYDNKIICIVERKKIVMVITKTKVFFLLNR